jgi:2',3'-cyclic-nucleotide 2'-phosphodiesterase (5'-nucleotidase family)
MTQDFIILHTNDIHGRIEGLARVATLVAQIRAAHPDTPVLYLDIGDSEDTSNRLSNLTKGAAMHRLLTVAGCDAAAVGNAAPLRYGPQVLPDHAAAARYPLLLANLRQLDGTPLPGVQEAAILPVGQLRLGLIGITADIDSYEDFFGLHLQPVLPIIHQCVHDLQQQGAEATILLSHMGLDADRDIAAGLQPDVALILGAHSHDLLPEGEQIRHVWVAQAGEYAQHLGRLDLHWDGQQLQVQQISVLPVPEEAEPSPLVLAEAATIEAEIERYLDEVIGELAEPLDCSRECECGVANLMADALRIYLDAEVAVVAAGQAFTGPLPAGPLKRVTLWDVCSSSANPGVVEMTGAQLLALVARGLDPKFARQRPKPLRGHERGLMHLSGASIRDGQLLVAGQPVDPDRTYRVAGSDWEFESYGGYASADWQLRPKYVVPTILREALENYLSQPRPVQVSLGRLENPETFAQEHAPA